MLICNHTFRCGEAVGINLMFDQIYKLSLWAISSLFCSTKNKFIGKAHLKRGKYNEIAMCYSKYRSKEVPLKHV